MDEVRELLAEYGRWRGDGPSSAGARERLAGIVAGLLRRSVPHAAVQMVDLDGDRGVSFDFEGRDYLVSFAHHPEDGGPSLGRTVTRTVRAAGLTGRPGDTRWALLYWPGGQEPVDEQLVDSVRAFGVVLDRAHLEAALAGLCPLADLVRDVFRRRQAHVPVADLLAAGQPAPEEWQMTPAARLTSPVRVETQTWAGTAAEALLVGQARQARPTGLAWQDRDTALITCPDGLLEVDTSRGHARWHLALPGCHGAPLVCQDGAVWVMCGSALVRWHQEQLSAVAGGFEPGSVLLPGPDGEPWVLSGSGTTLGAAGEGTLALTRAGDRAGDQLRYPITFQAAVRSAIWLDRRRFFLAASGHSAVVDLGRSTDAGPRQEWIPTAGHYPAHLLLTGADSVLSASPDGSGSRVVLHRTDVASQASRPLAELRLGEVFGLTQAPGDGPVYLLASLPGNDPARARPVLMRITGHRPTTPDTAPPEAAALPVLAGCDRVLLSARGKRRDYKLQTRPRDRGGQAEVFPAEHKASGTVVAFKRSLGKGLKEQRRMRREVTIAQKLGGNPHVMPVLDFSPAYDWFVMPMAQATAEGKRAELQDADQLRILVDSVAAALAEAHRHDWIHRDIKPSNILLLDGRWTVADWGIVRRPRGQTSTAGTMTGAGIGTEGFAAPELAVDGHAVTPASDIYSLGQLIGWIFTGIWPRPNVPLLPPPGPWYGVVRQATQLDPSHRPQDIAQFLDLVERETSPPTELPITRAQRLLEAADHGDQAAAAHLLALAADQPDSYELYLDAVAKLSVDTAETALLANLPQTAAVVRAMSKHVNGDRGNWPHWDEAARAVWWLLDVARLAAREEQWDLLDTAVHGMCDWDDRYDQWKPQDSITGWMRTLTGHAATIVASALRAYTNSARHLHELADDRRVDMAIRSAVHAASATQD